MAHSVDNDGLVLDLYGLLHFFLFCPLRVSRSYFLSSADLLDVPPAPQNGTYGRLHDIMVAPPPYPAPDLPVEEYANCPVPNRAQREARRDAQSECDCDDFHVGRHSGKAEPFSMNHLVRWTAI